MTRNPRDHRKRTRCEAPRDASGYAGQHNHMAWLVCIIIFTVSTVAFAANSAPPQGWRFPTEADYKDGWAEYRDRFPVPFHVTGDFDGDGLVDHAWILIREGGEGWGLFVFLARRAGPPRMIQLFSEGGCCAQAYALARVPPGKHLTFCGGRLAGCSTGQPASVTLRHPGFEFMTLGTASGLYYWSPAAKTFRSVTVAD
jgi:hypothetical protein